MKNLTLARNHPAVPSRRRRATRCLSLAILVAALTPLVATAGHCGKGKITHVNEGGWNFQGLAIKIDYTHAQSQHPGTEHHGYIRFEPSLGTERLNALRSLAMMGLASNLTLIAYSPSGNCKKATEITLSR